MMPVRGFLKMLLALFVFCALNLRHGISGLSVPEQHPVHARAFCASCINKGKYQPSTSSIRSMIGNIAASRSKRSSDDPIIKEPFYATPGIYLQKGQTYHMPCPIRKEGEKVSVFLWYQGKDIVARYTIVAGDTNFTQSDRFELSDTYGLIVRQVEQDDGGTYTCQVIPFGSSKRRESATDVTILDKQFPVVDDAVATRQEQNLTRGERHELRCPAGLPGNGNRRATVYWCLDTGESDFTRIIGVRFSDEETKVNLNGYNITLNSSLVIKSLKSNYSRFWCHLSVSGSPSTSGYIDVNGKDPRPGEMPTIHEPGNVKLSVILGLIFGLSAIAFAILFVWKLKRSRTLSHERSGTFPEPEGQIQQNRQVVRKEDGEMPPEDNTPLMAGEDADEKRDKVCLKKQGSREVDITDQEFIWNYLGQLLTEPALEVKNMSGFRHIKDVISIQDGGVAVIDSKGLHLFTAEYHYRFSDLYKALRDSCYICVAYFPDGKLLFGLKWGKLESFNIANEQINNFGSVTPAKDKIVRLNGIAVNTGFVFASDNSGKTISVFDHEGVYLKRLDATKIHPGSLALHVREGAQSVFVTSGLVVKKYHISGDKKQTNMKQTHHFDIDKETLGFKRFKPGHISVQDDKLLVVNHPKDPGILELLQLNVYNGKFLHSIIAKAPGIRGVKFISGDRIVLYSGDSVHVFEKGNGKQ